MQRRKGLFQKELAELIEEKIEATDSQIICY
jgi:hypothetical protein